MRNQVCPGGITEHISPTQLKGVFVQHAEERNIMEGEKTQGYNSGGIIIEAGGSAV